MMGAGLDSIADYAYDAFGSLSALSPRRQSDLRALVQFARRTVNAGEARRQLRLLAHGVFRPEDLKALGDGTTDTFQQLAEMTLRWSQDFLARLSASCSAQTKRLLAI
jgi:hypothetical protein